MAASERSPPGGTSGVAAWLRLAVRRFGGRVPRLGPEGSVQSRMPSRAGARLHSCGLGSCGRMYHWGPHMNAHQPDCSRTGANSCCMLTVLHATRSSHRHWLSMVLP